MPATIVKSGPGWGCSCRASRPGDPTPEQALAALARAADVTVEPVRTLPDGSMEFRAWTRPEDVYEVVYDPHREGWFCKHAVACSAFVAGSWLKAAMEGAKLDAQRRKSERRKRKDGD
jgi:hypothetical protein